MSENRLTIQAVREAIERIKNEPLVPHTHLIHPNAVDAEYARCADCLQVIRPRDYMTAPCRECDGTDTTKGDADGT
jgi:hypothetical protein